LSGFACILFTRKHSISIFDSDSRVEINKSKSGLQKDRVLSLLGLLEDWREALDKNQYITAVLMDLSKAFDCLPHNILLDKLSAYGVSPHSVALLKSYLSNRKQQIKVNNSKILWGRQSKALERSISTAAMY
jgi:hypothetical protein